MTQETTQLNQDREPGSPNRWSSSVPAGSSLLARASKPDEIGAFGSFRVREVPDVLLRGSLGQLAQQGGAQAAPLPGVGDGDSHLGLVRLPGDADEPGHPDQLPGVRRHRDQGFVVVVVDAVR